MSLRLPSLHHGGCAVFVPPPLAQHQHMLWCVFEATVTTAGFCCQRVEVIGRWKDAGPVMLIARPDTGGCCVVHCGSRTVPRPQVDKIVGRGADADFVKQLESLANSHHRDMGLDVIRAYHFGAR